jgi:hypothetical protein
MVKSFFYGSQIIIGKYFKQQGKSPYSYVQCDKGKLYIYSHLIRVVKFRTVQNFHKQKGGKLVYQLPRLLYLKYNL